MYTGIPAIVAIIKDMNSKKKWPAKMAGAGNFWRKSLCANGLRSLDCAA